LNEVEGPDIAHSISAVDIGVGVDGGTFAAVVLAGFIIG
jgi:hypothetical protein